MPRGRKTYRVQAIKEYCNMLLTMPANEHRTADFRKGVAAVLEHVLFRTDNYRGFNFHEWINEGGAERYKEALSKEGAELEQDKVYPKSLTAIVDTKPYIGDETRRFYY